MKNLIVSQRTAKDIEKRVEKILRGLGNPEPPLNVENVLELLNLDRAYYTGDDDNLIAEVASRLKVAGKQLVKRPSLLLDVIKTLNLKALYIPDQKRILIDQNLPVLKHRWNEAHEIAHQFIPWHADMMLGDTEHTLSKQCHEQTESEANYGAGQLLFMGSRFSGEASDCLPTFKSILDLRKSYGNTITSTLWRFIECSHYDLPMFGMISGHPRYPKDTFNPINPCDYFIQSQRFEAEFSTANVVEIYNQVKNCCSFKSRHIVGEGVVEIPNVNDAINLFKVEIFYNGYQALTLGVFQGSKAQLFF